MPAGPLPRFAAQEDRDAAVHARACRSGCALAVTCPRGSRSSSVVARSTCRRSSSRRLELAVRDRGDVRVLLDSRSAGCLRSSSCRRLRWRTSRPPVARSLTPAQTTRSATFDIPDLLPSVSDPAGPSHRPTHGRASRISGGAASTARARDAGSSIASICGALVRPSRRATARLSLTSTSVGTTSTLNRSASSGLVVDVDTRRMRRRCALLAREMGEQALHPARRPGALGAEEHEQGRRRRSISDTSCSSSVHRKRPGVETRTGGNSVTRLRYGGLVHDRSSRSASGRLRRALRGLLSATPLGRAAAVVLAGAAGARRGCADRRLDRARRRRSAAGVVAAAAAAIVVAGALAPRRHAQRARADRRGRSRSASLRSPSSPSPATSSRSRCPRSRLRLRRTQAERYAGLRSLARD